MSTTFGQHGGNEGGRANGVLGGAPPLPSRVQEYLNAVVSTCTQHRRPLTSLVLFGSAAKGGFSNDVSDVDLLVVLPDSVGRDDRRHLLEALMRLEVAHGFRPTLGGSKAALETFAERVGGNALSAFVCTRSDLLSGNVARVLDLNSIEAAFVDRIVFASIVTSAVTVWGEDLLPGVPIPPVRRVDVLKALNAFTNQIALSVAGYPVLDDATKYAMGTMKRSLHSCYFCYHRRTAPLEAEAAFFAARLGENRVLSELIALRANYRKSFGFVIRCGPTLARLHFRTLRDNHFPLHVTPAQAQ